MTHSTEQERAEFEAWAIANNKYHVSGYNPNSDLWEAWQAARRAQVVAVPQGLREAAQRAHDWMERQQRQQSKGGHATFDMMMLREERDALAEALAVAPQPPEAAPVQMPEAQAEVEVRSMKTYLDLSIHEWSDTLPDGCYKIYTEQQVRQLLEDHGIK